MSAYDVEAGLVGRIRNRLRRYPAVRSAYYAAKYVGHVVREGLWRNLVSPSATAGRQRVLEWEVPFPRVAGGRQLVEWLRSEGIRVDEGSHTIYVPPQDALSRLLPSVTRFYPANAGYKILRDFRPPPEANYLAGRGDYVASRGRLTGTPFEQATTANYMYCLGIGPRVWDVCSWRAGGNSSYTVFVVDHVDGGVPSLEQHAAFAGTLKHHLRTSLLRMLVSDGEEKPDFAPPACNGNLVQPPPPGKAQYIDFQNFRLFRPELWTRQILDEGKEDLHFGDGRPWRGRKYLYQSIPGIAGSAKRNTDKRWALILECLNDAGLDLRDRAVLDVGCNAGMILDAALKAGASWALGWDRAAVARHTERLLLSLGNSRFHVTGADLDAQYPIEDDVPSHVRPALSESVVFYLSVRQHVGLLDDLRRIPWRAMVYEGHQNERVEELPDVLAPLLEDGVRCAAATRLADGDSGYRPIALLVRNRMSDPSASARQDGPHGALVPPPAATCQPGVSQPSAP